MQHMTVKDRVDGSAMGEQSRADQREDRIFMVYEPSYDLGLLCTLGSVLLHTPGDLIIDIMTRPAYADHLSAIIRTIPSKRFLNKRINILQMPSIYLKECNSVSYSHHFKAEICFRLFYFDLVEPKGNVIYLDIDTIVLVDLLPLLEDLSRLPRPIAARQSPLPDVSAFLRPTVVDYFNSGVIFFNTQAFKSEILQKMRESQALVRKLADKSIYLDQDILNLVFHGRWCPLEARFNYKTSDVDDVDTQSDVILHAAGSRKPWFFGSRHRFSEQYMWVMTKLGVPVWKRYKFTWVIPRMMNVITRILK